MLIVSTIVMAVSIAIWIIIDIGNREDKRVRLQPFRPDASGAPRSGHRHARNTPCFLPAFQAHNAVLEMRPPPGNRQFQASHARRSIEVDRLERMHELSGGGVAVGRSTHTDHSEGMGNGNSYGYVQVSSSGVHNLRRRQA